MKRIEGFLLAIHATIAIRTEQPHWALEENEAAVVALAINDGLEHFLPSVSGDKLEAAMGAGAVIMIYGTRILTTLNLQRGGMPAAEPGGQVIYPPAPAAAPIDIATAAGQEPAPGADAPFAWARPAPGAPH